MNTNLFKTAAKKFVGLITAAVVLSVQVQSAYAFVVFDPSNWAQNYVSAIQSVKNELNTYNQYINGLMQIKHELQNLKEMGAVNAAARLAGVENELRSIRDLQAASQNLYRNLNSGQDYVTGIQKMINVSQLTAQQWAQREQKLYEQKNANATYLMKTGESIGKTIEAAQKQRDQILSDNPYDEGIRATAQKTNVMIGNLAQIQQEQLHAMKAQIEVQASNQAMEQNEKTVKERETKEEIARRIRDQDQKTTFKW
ncbi:hypothetical protein [Flavobacterium sp.]|uniref:hypothetical protein n=1 Tax=Flavobacterium sp. TaxID=239 RepID=UPI002603C327|nr:hypothetical protein [Flavobacterium sp.]